MNLTHKTKISLAYMTYFLAGAFMFFGWWGAYQKEHSIIVLASEPSGVEISEVASASAIPHQEEITLPSPTPIVGQVIAEAEGVIEEYILEVFGEDFDKAMLLLKGKDGECAENRGLDQNATHTNWSDVEGVAWSVDVGIFQVNDYFHPVYELNLDTDWKANVDYSFRMFQNDGETFSKRWTCGKWYASQGYDI